MHGKSGIIRKTERQTIGREGRATRKVVKHPFTVNPLYKEVVKSDCYRSDNGITTGTDQLALFSELNSEPIARGPSFRTKGRERERLEGGGVGDAIKISYVASSNAELSFVGDLRLRFNWIVR